MLVEVIAGTSAVRRIRELVEVSGVGLAAPVVTTTLQETDQTVAIEADRTDEVRRLSIGHVLLKLKDQRAFASLEKLVSSFFGLEFVMSQQLTAHSLERLAKLNVRHIRHSQFVRKLIEQLGSFSGVWRFSSVEQTFDGCNCGRSFSGQANSIGRQTDGFVNGRDVHSFLLTAEIDTVVIVSTINSNAQAYPGVILNFVPFYGTGAGRHAHEISEISFSDIKAPTQ